MTSTHRSLARLPLHIFENLQYQSQQQQQIIIDEEEATSKLRSSICTKLRQPPRSLRDAKEPITTVGSFLKLSLITLLQLLDPLLTYGKHNGVALSLVLFRSAMD